MPRLHLIELEDQPWLPVAVRAGATDMLRLLFSTLVTRSTVVDRVRHVLERTGERRILDLCSGSSGPLGPVLDELSSQGLEVEALLTDLHPHPDLGRNLSSRLRYRSEPLDARRVPTDLEGLRTCFAGFHHFEPEDAIDLLARCARQRRGLAFFEPSTGSLTDYLAVPWIGLASIVAAPFLRPFSWRRLFWTWLVPLIPIVVVWDGWVSCARFYTVDELRGLAESALDRAEARGAYRFEVGWDPLPGLPAGHSWILGWPEEGDPGSVTGGASSKA